MQRVWQLIVVLAAGAALTGCAHGLRKADQPETASVPVQVQAEAGTTSEAAPTSGAPLVTEGPATKNDLTDTGDDMKNIPHEVNRLVLEWIDYFQGRGRPHMERYLSRSGRYIPMMKEILKKEGLPEDLVYIALIESGFSAHAKSWANAVGYWQFIRSTGRSFGLRVDSYVDERRDFVKATHAASAYFKGLYNLFGSWYLAIASYNVGENRIKSLVMKYHSRDFWALARDRKLPKETVNYVPKFLAARMIAKEPEKYGFSEVEYMEPLAYEEIEVPHSVDLRKMAISMGLEYEDISALNPAYKRGIGLDSSGKLMLRIPKETAEAAKIAAAASVVLPGRAMAASVASGEDDYAYHRVRRGETVASIARKYRTSTKSIRRLNRLSASSRIIAGKRIKVPGESIAAISKREINSSLRPRDQLLKGASRASSMRAKTAAAGRKVHIVRQGDTLIDIARHYKVTLQQLASHNRLSRRARINIGARLEIPE